MPGFYVYYEYAFPVLASRIIALARNRGLSLMEGSSYSISIPNEFKGALSFTKDDLLKVSKDLILYPLAVFNATDVLYKDLDISHGELPFIVKISGHANIDVLSTDKYLLKKVLDASTSNGFILKPYKGTSL